MKKCALLTACAVLTAASLALYGCGFISGMGSKVTEKGGSSGGNNNGSGGDNSGGSGGSTDNPGNGGSDKPGNGGSGGSGNTVFSEAMTGTGNPADYFKATLLQKVENADGTIVCYYVLDGDSTLTIPEATVSTSLGMTEGFVTKYLDSSNITYYEGGFDNPRGLFTNISGSFHGGNSFGSQLWVQANIPTADGTIQNMRWLFSVAGTSTTAGYFKNSTSNAKQPEYGTFTRSDSTRTISLRYANPDISLIRYRYPNMEQGLETRLFADFMQDYRFSFDSLWNTEQNAAPESYSNVQAKMIPVVVTTVHADGTWGKSHLERIFPPFF